VGVSFFGCLACRACAVDILLLEESVVFWVFPHSVSLLFKEVSITVGSSKVSLYFEIYFRVVVETALIG
jgi:hypothetical protein